jgi:hypothetical protein
MARLSWLINVIGIAVGLAGIYFSVMTNSTALNAVADVIRGTAAPGELRSVIGISQLFVICLFVVLSYCFLALGLGGVVKELLSGMNAGYPGAAAFSFVALATSAAASLALLSTSLSNSVVAAGFAVWFLGFFAISAWGPIEEGFFLKENSLYWIYWIFGTLFIGGCTIAAASATISSTVTK